jgi:UDP-glucose 4-epimerase
LIYLVTGGAGFIGSHIVEELVKRKEKVRVLDNFSTGKRENIEGFLDKIELIEADLQDLEKVRGAVQGIDYILHQAALPSVPRSIKDPFSTLEVNVKGTLNILIASQKAKVKRVVYASSSSVYGDSPTLPKEEQMKPGPLSPYAVSKFLGEEYGRVFSSLYNLEVVILRYFNVFGSRQDPASQYSAAIPKFIESMLKGDPPTIYGDGEQSRDFTFVDNVVEANLAALEAKDASGEVFNIASGGKITVNELVEKLNKILNKNIKSLHIEPRPGDVQHSLADISRAKKILGYNPKFGFEEGLKKTAEWY